MKYAEGQDVRCAYAAADARNIAPERLRPLFTSRRVSGRALNARFQQTFVGRRVPLLRLITVVHRVAVRNPTTGEFTQPVVDQPWVDTLFRVANDIWSQACIKLIPYSTGTLVTSFRDIALSAFAGDCITTEQRALVAPFAVTAPGTLILNVYLVEDTNNIACGSPVHAEVFLPTEGRSPDLMGRVFAHEIGHVLLNPLGVDDNANPDHLMFHPEAHPDVPPGSQDGLFLSDCIGAHTRAREDFAAFVQPGLPGSGQDGEAACVLNPRLGNNLVIVATEHAQV
jgi:hypothetical protein